MKKSFFVVLFMLAFCVVGVMPASMFCANTAKESFSQSALAENTANLGFEGQSGAIQNKQENLNENGIDNLNQNINESAAQNKNEISAQNTRESEIQKTRGNEAKQNGAQQTTEKVSKIQTSLAEDVFCINFAFQSFDNLVEGGVFEILPQENVSVVGSGFSSTTVQAQQNSFFQVQVFVRQGFRVDLSNFYQTTFSLFSVSNVSNIPVSFADTGFSQAFSFVLKTPSSQSQTVDFCILLQSLPYTVSFVDNGNVVAKVKNVLFNSAIDISQQNFQNIQLFSTTFEDGKIFLAQNLERYRFVGYFTADGGQGKQYVFADGNTQQTQSTSQPNLEFSPNLFLESGYVLNPVTSKYTLSSNAKLLSDGTIEISLYAYRTIQSTQIQFVLQSNLSTKFNALAFVSGAQNKDFWFSTNNPMQLELAFNTNISFVAPEIEGYKFYRFIIRRQSENGTWMPDAISYNPQAAWFANETDNFVKCEVEIVYFAHISVCVFDGKATYRLQQQSAVEDETGKAAAEALVKQGFVDTTRSFSAQAVAESGYVFGYWQNAQTGQAWASPQISILASGPMALRIFMQGQEVVLDLSSYDCTHGQIVRAQISNAAGPLRSELLGSFENGTFKKTQPQLHAYFGQKVTFQLQMDRYYAIMWPQQDFITYEGYSGGFHNFSMQIFVPENDMPIEICPIFESQKLSYYVTPLFESEQIVWDATDNNNGFLAAKINFGSVAQVRSALVDKDSAVEFDISAQKRYEISKILVKNLDKEFDAMQLGLYQNNKLKLSENFITSNNFDGIVQIEIVLSRKMWQNLPLQQTQFVGGGTVENPYQISSAAELARMAQLCNSGQENAYGVKYRQCSYQLCNNISLSEEFWTLVGTADQPFEGTFNFKGHHITGVFLVKNQISQFSIFGEVSSLANISSNYLSGWFVAVVTISGVILAGLLIAIVAISHKRKALIKQLSVK